MNTGTVPTEEIRKALDAKYWTLEQATQVPTWLRSLLEENERITKERDDAHLKFGRATLARANAVRKHQKMTFQIQQLREELEQVKKEREEVFDEWHNSTVLWNNKTEYIRSELAAKDKVLEWYGETSTYDSWGEGVPVWEDKGTLARSILSQYPKES